MTQYNEYLASQEWKAKSAEFKRSKGECYICGGSEHLETHHRTYRRKGKERRNDFVCLCRRCHQAVHDYIFVEYPPKSRKDALWCAASVVKKLYLKHMARPKPAIDAASTPNVRRRKKVNDDL